MKVDRNFTSTDVIDTLAELFAMHRVPQHFRSDNGPEFIAQELRSWLEQLGVRVADRCSQTDLSLAAQLQPSTSTQLAGLPGTE